MQKKKGIIRGIAMIFSFVVMLSPVITKASDIGNDELIEGSNSSSVYIDVVKKDRAAKLKVEVPTRFAFVVLGTNEQNQNVEVTVGRGNLLIPNYTVDLIDQSDPNKGYKLSVTGSNQLYFDNYSTVMAEQAIDGSPNVDPSVRQGVGVKVSGYIEQTGESLLDRKGWDLVKTKPQAVADDYKKYSIGLKELNDPLEAYAFEVEKSSDPDKLFINREISLEKPIESGGYSLSGFAKVPSSKYVLLDLSVGGLQSQYNVTEESLKVGSVIWSIELEEE